MSRFTRRTKATGSSSSPPSASIAWSYSTCARSANAASSAVSLSRSTSGCFGIQFENRQRRKRIVLAGLLEDAAHSQAHAELARDQYRGRIREAAVLMRRSRSCPPASCRAAPGSPCTRIPRRPSPVFRWPRRRRRRRSRHWRAVCPRTRADAPPPIHRCGRSAAELPCPWRESPPGAGCCGPPPRYRRSGSKWPFDPAFMRDT